MVEQSPYFRSYDPDNDPYNEDNSDRQAPYPFERSTRSDFQPEPAPLFLSDYDSEPDPSEFAPSLRSNRKAALSFRILAGVLVASAAALLVTVFSSDVTRGLIVNAKASINAALQGQSASARPTSAQLTARDMQLKDPARAPVPALASTAGARTPATTVAMAPTREEITTAYQSALQSHAPAAAALAAAAPAVSEPTVAAAAAPAVAAPVAAPSVAPAPRKIDADELATLLKRAKDSLASGDIPVARLLLERAANVEPTAAFLLAETYDPAVLGTVDTRSITPDPATARLWYQRAAQLGSTDAEQRLAQLQN
jgi:hypothetical protein